VTNAQEFGDDVGYNARIEEAAVKAAGLDYVGIPLVGAQYTTEFVRKNIEPKVCVLRCMSWRLPTRVRAGTPPPSPSPS
jgi:hypothetical protein